MTIHYSHRFIDFTNKLLKLIQGYIQLTQFVEGLQAQIFEYSVNARLCLCLSWATFTLTAAAELISTLNEGILPVCPDPIDSL